MPAGAVLPATSIATTPVRDDGLLASLHPVRVTEPCPTSTSTPNGSQQSLAVSTALESVLGQVLAYGGEHVDEFGGYGLVWDGPRHAAVFAAFASDLSPHRAALATIVSDPKDLIVCQVAVSERVARALMAKLMDDLQGRFASIGIGPSGLSIVLMPDEQALADALKNDYGDAVTVSFCSAAVPCTYPAA